MRQSGRRQTVNSLVKVTHVMMDHCLLQGCSEVTGVACNLLSFQAQTVGLGRRQHLVSVKSVLLPLSHLFWQLGEHATMLVVNMFGGFRLWVCLLQFLLV